MASDFSREQTKIAVAKILRAYGWQDAKITPLEILTDLLVDYIKGIGTATTKYANEFGCAQPNLHHLDLVFRDFHINLTDLRNHCKNTTFEKCNSVPQYPLPKEDHLNFPDPESAEAATGPAHIQELFLPSTPLMPKMPSTENITLEQLQQPLDLTNRSDEHVFKKPSGVAPVRKSFTRPRVVTTVKTLSVAHASRRLQSRY